ncbi:MAG: DUF4097 domain-containing protein [Gammaproteobacteria bacterium]|nr:DUF4097 domain-containing protein [Gammaproteobacteria bacterium]MYH86060.1 DUF4097 domain-containing protein [Gammaproteobacteria bacterium]
MSIQRLKERHMYQSTFKTVVACLVTVALAGYSWAANGQDIERSFTVAEGDRVVVDVERADLNITAWDRSEVGISVSNTERYEFDFSQENGVVTINGEYDRPGFVFGGFSNRRSATVTMNVPYRQNLDLRTSGGDIDLDRLQGEFHARTSGGNIEAGAIDGSSNLRTSGGTIRLENSSGPVVAETSGGSINIESAGGAVFARTSGGSVEVGFAGQPDGDSELRTSGGSVTAYLNDDVQANIDASTSGGRVTSDIPGVAPENSAGRSNLEQALNGGGPELVMRTSGGSVRILRHEN